MLCTGRLSKQVPCRTSAWTPCWPRSTAVTDPQRRAHETSHDCSNLGAHHRDRECHKRRRETGSGGYAWVAVRGTRVTQMKRRRCSESPCNVPRKQDLHTRKCLSPYAGRARNSLSLVCAARRAAEDGDVASPWRRRFSAAPLACLESAANEAAWCGSFRRACKLDHDRFGSGRLPARDRSWAAFLWVFLLAVAPGFFAIPARRAWERPMAMACFVFLAPCFPSRIWCISSRMNSPAAVDWDFP